MTTPDSRTAVPDPGYSADGHYLNLRCLVCGRDFEDEAELMKADQQAYAAYASHWEKQHGRPVACEYIMGKGMTHWYCGLPLVESCAICGNGEAYDLHHSTRGTNSPSRPHGAHAYARRLACSAGHEMAVP